MTRIIVVGVALLGLLLVWKSGALNSIGPQNAPPPLDPGPIIGKSGDAMRSLKSVHFSITGTLEFQGVGGARLTGSGDLKYPHTENLSLQIQVPGSNGQVALLAINEKIENGHDYEQIPSQGPQWKDVTGDTKSQVLPEMDPVANLDFANAFRASDDLGDITMDNIDVHHFSLSVDSGKYVEQLKADPNSGITPADEAVLTDAGIQVEVWISASDRYMHQMKIDMSTSQFTWSIVYHYSDWVPGGGPQTA